MAVAILTEDTNSFLVYVIGELATYICFAGSQNLVVRLYRHQMG